MQSIDASVIEAIELAARQHQGQFRKGKRKSAYINHPIQLMGVLIRHQENDSDLLKAAALHDVIEDTAKTREEIQGLSQTIESKFGKEVLKVVREVSDDKNLPFRERKRLQIVNTPQLSQHAKKIKIADKTCNIMDMMDDPPTNWSTDRKLEYLYWAEQVIEGARGVNPALEDYFDQTRKQAYRQYTQDNTE
ncbi:MAG: bifunctional (p)ppGpp synthetase/guanosine-3',5'-bis(diphosphate) 3'-pyrophosphohydrolase [Bacteroidales bacterium]|nr:bifunctional (p)ppGpp synthetase/guanosine-3',5'-bis(diphosphate) 3'-pyrophosphohydrolase [Bacteroidales bacterium]